jgi:hypothetical protein
MKSKENKVLSPRQLQVLPHLLSSPSYEEAARRSGVSVKQIFVWLKDPTFQKELRRNQSVIFTEAISSLKASTLMAVETLTNCLTDPESRVRLSAAEKILTHAFRGIELFELEERLQEVEKKIERAKTDAA